MKNPTLSGLLAPANGPIEIMALADTTPIDAPFFETAREIGAAMGAIGQGEYRARRKTGIRWSVLRFHKGSPALLSALVDHSRDNGPAESSVGDPVSGWWQ